MASRSFWIFIFGVALHSVDCHPVETKNHDQLKAEITGIKSEIQELFERINELSSAKAPKDDQTVETYHSDDNLCLSKECIATSNNLFKQMDLTADPCQDFNQFSCGNFIKETPIPDDKTRYNSFSPPRDKVVQRGRILLEKEDTEKCFDADKMSRRWYKACVNETEIEKLGVQPLLDSLKTLGGWPVLEKDSEKSYDSFKWYEQTTLLNKEGFSLNYIMSHYIDTDDKNNSYRVFKIDQTSLGMSREYLIKGFEDKDVQAYYQYMVDAAVLLGADETKAMQQLKESLVFEIALANLSAPREERRDANKLYNPTTLGELGGEGYKAEDHNGRAQPPSWQTYIQGLVNDGLNYKEDLDAETIVIGSDEKVIVRNPAFFKNVTLLLINTDPKVIANYMAWRVVKGRLNYLNKAAEDIRQKYNKAITGVASKKPTWKKCVGSAGFGTYSYTSGAGAAGSMYVRTYFKPEEKQEMLTMITYIRASFGRILDDLPWMDAKTKVEAKNKLEKMDQFIAYPDELIVQDKVDGLHKGLEANGNYYQNIIERSKFWSAFEYKQLREKIDPKNWVDHQAVALVNAFYNPSTNSMEFPAGILQGVFFNSKIPKYMNFGAVGGVIGHEITHGFDDQGRRRDYEGTLRNWWSNSTSEQYEQRAQCIINQYGNYTAEQVGINLNGVNNQGENIADNGGIKEAYGGYLDWVNDQKSSNGKQWEEKKLPGHDFTPKQLFWISWGQVWCAKWRDGALKQQIKTGQHSPGEFRIKGSLSNNNEFSKDFNCPTGSPMNPEEKCSVW